MFAKVKRNWRTFAQARPGQRFRASYERQHRQAPGAAAGVLWVAAGAALIVVGAVFLVIPGPGIPIVAVGAALIARQFRPVARLLDGFELVVRKAIEAVKRYAKAVRR